MNKQKDCGRRWEKWILLWQEKALAPRRAKQVEAHLKACAACRETAEEYRLLKKELGAHAEIIAPVFTAPVNLAPETFRPASRRRLAGWATACLLVLVVAGILRVSRFQTTHHQPEGDWFHFAVEDTNLAGGDYYYLLLLERLASEEQTTFLNLVAN